jgi:hypothetical protein
VPDAVQHVDLELGLYVLGALGSEDMALVEDHLRQCASCTDAYDFIRDLPSLLARQSPEDVAHLLATTGGNAGNGKRASHMPAVSTAAAHPVIPGQGRSRRRPGRPFVMTNASDTACGICATVTVWSSPPGSTVELLVHGLKAGVRYALTAVSRGGRTLPVIEWVATGADQTVHCEVAVAVGELTSFAVAGPDGVVLTVPFAAGATRE